MDEDDGIDEAAIWEQIKAKEAAEREAAARPSPEQVLYSHLAGTLEEGGVEVC
jgi:hypothetical protein